MDSSSPRTIIISSRHNNTTKQKAINISSLPPNPIQNPKLVLTHDIVRNTKTLHCIIYTNQQPSSKIEYPAAMRGYAGIMSTSCNKDIELNGQGHKVHMEECHHLWMPQGEAKNDPLWHLRISVLRDQCARGDCPSKSFAFDSQDSLVKAAFQLESAFSEVFDIRKCGGEAPDAMGGRVNDGRSENITISFSTDKATAGWEEFLGKLKSLEKEWAEEGTSML